MPRTLLLLRHARAAALPGGSDADRPLTEAGRAEATAVGAALPGLAPPPDLVLVSTARRATETAEALGLRAETWQEHDLYLAPSSAIIERVREVDDAVQTLLVVGHNPGLHQAVLDLAAVTSADVPRFVPGTVAALAVDAARWADLHPGDGRILALHAPGG